MTRNLLLSHATDIESVPNFFAKYWPHFTDNTKRNLHNELYPYLIRCVELLYTLEPQLFSTERQTDSNSSTQTLSSSALAHTTSTTRLTESQMQTISRGLARAPAITRLAPKTSRAQSTSRQLSRAPARTPGAPKISRARSISHQLTQVPKVSPTTTKLPPKRLPHSIAYIKENLSSFVPSATKVSKEPYLAIQNLETTVWIHVVELRFRYLGMYELFQTLQRDQSFGHCTGPKAKEAITQRTIHLHPDLKSADIKKNINQYIERGKNYQKMVDDNSLLTVISLSADNRSQYEYRQTIDVYNTLISGLYCEGAKRTDQLDLLPDDNPEKILEMLLRRLLEQTFHEYYTWYYGAAPSKGINDNHSLFPLMKAALSTENNHNADEPTGHIDARTCDTETLENMQTCQTRLNPSADQQRTDISTVPTPAMDNIVFGVPEIRTFLDTDIPRTPEVLPDALQQTFFDTNLPGMPEVLPDALRTAETFLDTNTPRTPDALHTTETLLDTNIHGTPQMVLKDALYTETFFNSNIPRTPRAASPFTAQFH